MYRIKMNPIPTSSYSGRVKQVAGRWTHSGIKQTCDILVIMLFGECDFEMVDSGTNIHLRKNECTIIKAGNFYKGSCQDTCEYYFFHIPRCVENVSDGEVRQSILTAQAEMKDSNEHFYIHANTVYNCVFLSEIVDVSEIIKKLTPILAECDIELAKRDVNRKLRFDFYLCQIIMLISEESMRRFMNRPTYPVALDRILTYINENYTEPMTLEWLSEYFGLSKQYLIRLFRTHLGTTVTKYINEMKLLHAPELLAGTTLNVSEVAEHLGFSSAGYFARLFKEKYSVSPTKFI